MENVLRNYAIDPQFERRYGDWNTDRFLQLAADLVRLKVDVIVVMGTSAWRSQTRNQTRTCLLPCSVHTPHPQTSSPQSATSGHSKPFRSRPLSLRRNYFRTEPKQHSASAITRLIAAAD
jgi:hypothetical protein